MDNDNVWKIWDLSLGLVTTRQCEQTKNVDTTEQLKMKNATPKQVPELRLSGFNHEKICVI
jgi:hypothetical protein